MFGYEFYVDPSRCIGCRSCLQACEECDTHRGKSMINFDFIERRESISSSAYVCWHCDEPTCAQVCPADAIKKGDDGIGAGRRNHSVHAVAESDFAGRLIERIHPLASLRISGIVDLKI